MADTDQQQPSDQTSENGEDGDKDAPNPGTKAWLEQRVVELETQIAATRSAPTPDKGGVITIDAKGEVQED